MNNLFHLLNYKKAAAVAFFFLFIVNLSAQLNLPRSFPEAEGVSSEAIIKFLDAADKSKHEFHSFMFLRHGKVIAEAWWKPYAPNLRHSMYSVSKSFTSTAIGFLISEKRITVDDKVISFFQDQLPDTISPFLAELKVKDMLSMSVGQEPDPTGLVITRDSNWVKGFLALPIIHKPGTKFLYNSLGTYMLSAIVQKVSGQKTIDYLQPRLLKPLGIDGTDWETDPMGINTGGWGLRIITEGMAKFGQLYLQKGVWNGKQILPQSWIEEATTKKIDQAPDMPQSKKDSSDWVQGYCYQIWRSRHNSYRGDGAFGQYIVVMPEQDAVVIITSETPDLQGELNMVWDFLLPAIHNKKSTANKYTAILKQKLSSRLLLPPAKSNSPITGKISGKTFSIEPNEKNIASISFRFSDNNCYTLMEDDTAVYKIAFGNGKWIQGLTTKRGPSLTAAAKGHFKGLPPPKIAGSYQWKDNSTLVLHLRYIESPHTETITCRFIDDKILIDFHDSFDWNEDKRKRMQGELRKAVSN